MAEKEKDELEKMNEALSLCRNSLLKSIRNPSCSDCWS